MQVGGAPPRCRARRTTLCDETRRCSLGSSSLDCHYSKPPNCSTTSLPPNGEMMVDNGAARKCYCSLAAPRSSPIKRATDSAGVAEAQYPRSRGQKACATPVPAHKCMPKPSERHSSRRPCHPARGCTCVKVYPTVAHWTAFPSSRRRSASPEAAAGSSLPSLPEARNHPQYTLCTDSCP